MQTEVRESERLLDLDDLDWLPIAGPDLEHARATALRRPRVYDLRYSVGDYVDRHARQRPRDIAVRDERFRLSYEELAERTRECAIALRKAVEADSRIIAVSGPLGAHTAVAFLGIERIGAIYLPVDETWPRLRIESLLVRSGAAAIAWTGSAPASEALRGAATACNIPMVSMEDASAQGVGWSYPATLADPATLRYVLYTSGSTGQPKGAVVEHQGMMNHLHAKVEDLGLTADDVVAQTAPMSFDISVWQMLAALIVGGQTYFVADEDTYLPERLIDCVAKQGITILELVPTVIRLIVEELERSARPAFATLRYLLATGEALPSSTARRWLRAVPQVPLVNAYGPTECSDDVTHHFVTEASANAHNIPIGRPISNASLFVLAYEGDRLRACNDAEPGELFASGVCVGRGYLGDPAKTRAAFFRDPFLETPTGRVYRTGDLVRRLDSGELEYLGRVDRQVKVSGVRIELGEIEETIRSYDAVSAVAVVIVRRSNGDGTEEPKLVACVSPADVPITTLHSYLRARLPAAMVPHEFVCLASLPLSDNGKIDYGSLVHRASTSRMQGEESVGVMLTHAALCARLAEGRPSVESAGEVGLLARLASGETFVLGDADYDVRTELSADSSFTARWRPNERMYVLDAFGEPVPIGVPGDLYLGGPTIPQGFLNDPRSTAERFVPDRFGGSGARLYRTNTKARVCAEGTIEIIQIEEEGDEGKRRYEPPVGATESALASIWCELLKLERVGRHDNFFELGGHSLLAIRLLSRIRHRLAMQASLTVLFTSPTLSGFAQVLVSSARTTTAPLVLIDRNQPLPLSFAQQRLWFLAQLEGGSEAYHISLGVRLQGVLDRAAFRQALDRIVARHESLRTTFASIDGEPVQQIAPADVGFALGEHDLRDRPDAVQQLIDQEASAPFDLERGPLIRGRLIALADDEHVLLVTMHHIVSDGWSMGVFMRELSTLYTAFSRGRDDPLSPLSLQYADYAVWQRRWLSGDVLQAQTSYWREALSGAPVLLELPWDRPRPVVQDYHGEYVRIELDAELSAGLRALSRRHGTTLFMTLLSAWGALVSRLSGQSEVVIGTPVANRTRPEIEELIGFFVNTLALRLDYSGSPPVSELLERVKMVALSAQEHQDVPFEQVVELLNPPRSLSHTPLFQTMFVWEQDDPGSDADIIADGISIDSVAAARTVAKFDLELALSETDDEIVGRVKFAHSLFDRTTVERWAGYLPELLSAMVADDARRIDGIGVLPAAEREQLVEWNATDRTYASDVCVHELFDAQVVQRPDAVAIVYEDAQLSYGELDARANRLAHYLRTLGVGPDRRVALCLERSVELIVSILAVLKAGGAYVPLDPSYPSERLQYMLDDSAPVAVLTHGAIDPSVRALLDAYGAPTIDLDDDAAWADEPSTAPSRDGLTPRHAAYVIYTSGSTGRPKGVIVEHGNVTRLFGATQRWFAFGPTDVWTLFHSFAFDFSVWELFGALLYGGRLVIVPHLVSRSPEAFYDLLCQVGVTVLNQTPSAFGQLIEAQRQSSQEHALHCVIFGGEALDTSMLAPWYEDARNGSTRLINMYGITETTVHVTYREVGSVSDRGVLGSLIGERIADLQVYVLDSKGNLAPIGVPGELYVGGGGVARGYLNRAELTAERFVPDPFGGAGARLYRTGDLARYRNDGTLEFLGRGDFQVKIRGFRIELGEIEGRLREHPDVREAVVVAREDTPGDKRLVAYYTGAEGAEFGASELRAHLQAVLPEYMVPGAYVALEQLPLLPNGKLDRRSLPAPDGAAYTVREYEAPVGEIEEALASIWRELLKLERVGRHDNFFQLGGHSLLVVRAIERMRRLGLYADVATFFTAPSLAGVAAMVRTQSAAVVVPPNGIVEGCEEIEPWMVPLIELDASEIDRIVAAVPGGTRNIADIYPLAPLQEGILFHHLLESGRDPYVLRSIYRFEHRARLDAYLAALQVVIDRHDILRTAVLWEGLREPVQVVWRRAPLSVEEIVVGEGEEAVAALSARFDLQTYRLDVGRAPMMHVGIAREQHGDGWVMALLTHHLIRDHVTGDIFDEEIRAHLTGQADTLPPPYPFRNYIVQARLGVSKAEHEAYFRSLLADVDEPTAPFGLLDVHCDGSRIAQAGRWLKRSLSSQLRVAARRLGTSVASVCHVAWAQVVAQTSGRPDVVFGTVLFGRMQGGEGFDRATGVFINTLPVRVVLGNHSVEQSVLETHAQLARLLHHEHASLASAQRCSAVASPAPLFSALLNYRHIAPSGEAARSRSEEGIEALRSDERSNYPFSLDVNDFGDGLSLRAQVDASLDPDRICAMMETALERIVGALEGTPSTPIHALDVLGAAEREQLLVEWNATDRTYASDVCVHELFDAQVVQRPDAVAIVYEDAQLSYGELDVRANRLAHYLRTLGVGPDRRVALCLERSVELIVSILAVLKAGGAYVPLDPSYPSERLQYMLSDCAPVAVLTHGAIDPSVRALLDQCDVPTIDLDDAAAWAGQPSSAPKRADLCPSHAAYVIYTSGSTGRPKGVIVEHRSLVNLLLAIQAVHELCRNSAVLQKNQLTFDPAVQEILQPLVHGARLVLARAEGHKDPRYLAEVIRAERITTLHFVPSMLELFVEQEQSSGCTSLQRITCGGEALPGWLAVRCLERLPWVELVNFYGPAEATVDATTWSCARSVSGGSIPIGRPIGNVRTYVLDAYGDPVPIGVAGELYIGGVQVARGYLNRAELTAERFVPDPFGGAGARLYRTGDLARYRNDGTLEFLGRGDFQVKIRGFRIELGEIEGRLREHPDVREAVVVAREDTPGDKRLVAYYTGAEGAEFGASELRAHLQAVLPEYMVPAAYVALEQLPLLPNGKLDRRSLPAPDDAAYTVREYEAPVGEIEETLASIWRELLGVQRVGRHDNFFQLGGHSLLVVRAIERMRRLGLYADVATFFTAPSLAGVAAMVRTQSAAVVVPPNGIVEGCEEIEPWMVPLIELDASEIDRIVAAVPGGTRNIADIYPLAPLQEGILFHHLLESGRDPYVLQSVYRFADRAKLDAYLAALQVVIDRHDVLRTAVVWEGLREPVQVVWRRAPLSVEEIVVGEGEEAVAALSARFDLQTYRLDVGRAPMMHVGIAREQHGDGWVMALLTHHLIGDHVTGDIIEEEIAAHLSGRAESLAPALPFRNFIAQARLGVSRAEHEAYFRSLLGDVEEPTAPFGLLDVRGDGSSIAQAKQWLEPEVSQRLRGCARALGVSTASLCHVAWAQVLAQTSGRSDVVFGTVLFGRMQGEGSDRAMGLFINTLPVRIALDDRSVVEVVKQTQAQLAQLLHHEHASLALAQRRSAVPPSVTLFSALLNYRHIIPSSQLAAPRPEGMEQLGGEERSNYPFSIDVNDLGEELSLKAQVDASLDPERICALMQTALVQLVDALEEAPSRSALSLRTLPPAEREQLVEWNATDRTYASDVCVHELFDAQVVQRPDAVAIVYEDAQLSYGELDARANRLAHYLRTLGVGPDRRVALCLERSVELVVSILAVLKAGGAYVPLDPSYPSERLQYMLDDSAPVAVLTHGAIDPSVRALLDQCGVPTIDLDDAAAWAGQPSSAPKRADLCPSHAAYVIYTSGSTGRPKGVIVEHRSLANQTRAVQERCGITGSDRVLQFSAITFDASLEEVFGSLTCGAALILRSDAWLAEPQRFWQLCHANEITLLDLPTLFWEELAQDGVAAIPACVRAVVIGGQAVGRHALEAWFTRDNRPALLNSYGPTETTVDVTVQTVTTDETTWSSIGRPIANMRTYVLDAYGDPVPIGVAGELYIGGVQVARGYLNRAELTAERFVPDPFGGAGARLYRTGDLARYRNDGTLEFLGRGDFQVKIRGFRIELGEIEGRLREHPDVREAVVVAREDTPGDKRLVAYYTGAEGAEFGASELRAHLQAVLPEYMVPGAYVALEQLPLLPNGKLDRRSLPAPDGAAYTVREYEAPVGEIEEALASIWRELLKLERVGRHDNFFELGGHSLTAMLMASRLSQLEIEMASIAPVFKYPMLRMLAAFLESNNTERGQGSIALRSTGTQRPLFLMHEFFSGVYFSYLTQHISADIPVYGLPPVALGDPQLNTMEGIAERLVRIIRSVAPSGPYRLAGWSFGGIVAYEVAMQLIGQDEQVEFLGLLDTGYEPSQTNAEHDRLVALRQALLMLLKEENDDFPQPMALYSGDHNFEELLQECRRYGLRGRYSDYSDKDIRLVCEQLAAHEHAYRGYVTRPISVPISLFVAKQEDAVSDGDGTLGWSGLLPIENIRVITVPGDHVTMMEGENAAELGRLLSDALCTTPGKVRQVSANSCIIIEQGDLNRIPVFCVPGAGDNALAFMEMAASLGKHWPISGLQPRSLEFPIEPHRTVEAAAHSYLALIDSVAGNAPVHLVGHSFGGWIALELARRMLGRHRPPASVTIIDSEPPDLSGSARREFTEADILLEWVNLMELTAHRPLLIGEQTIQNSTFEESLQLIHRAMVSVGLLPSRSDSEMLLGPVWTFASALRTTYAPDSRYTGTIHYAYANDPRLSDQANSTRQYRAVAAWRLAVDNLVHWHAPGDHITALKKPNIGLLIEWWKNTVCERRIANVPLVKHVEEVNRAQFLDCN